MISTGVRLFSQDEYHRMAETGILAIDERVELLEGQIILMAAKNPPHSATNLCAAEYLRTLLVGLALIRIQDPIDLNPFSEPEPDIAVVRIDRHFYAESHPTPADVFLLIEISDTTLERDRKQKAAAYARAGIADYWILDVNTRQVRVFREIVNERYQQESILLNEEATLFMLAFPEIAVQINQLFP